MIEKTEALVLRIAPFSSTSHVVTWLTPDRGRLATVIKGACRPKSPFLGQYDLFYTCELLYYSHARKGLHIARECSPIHLRKALRTRWRAFALASYCSGLTSRISLPGHHEETLYPLLNSLLDALLEPETLPALLPWFELRLLRLLGLAPQVDACAICSRALPEKKMYGFSSKKGGLACPTCCSAHTIQDATPLPPDVRAILAHWLSSATPRQATALRFTPKQWLACSRILDTFISFHLDVPRSARRIALELGKGKT